ncbi:MAG: DUF4430 domain-containing protein [Solibacillus sp.]
MMKKTTAMLILLLTLILSACNFQTVEQYEQMEEKQRSIENEQLEKQLVTVEEPEIVEQKTVEKQTQEIDEQLAPVEEKEKEKEKVENTEIPQQPEQKQEQEQKQPAQQTQSKPAETKPVEKQQSTTAVTPNKKPDSTQVEQKQPVVEQPKSYVTISIHANTLLKNLDKLDPALQSEQYVPANGTILSSKKYELLSDKDTVWTVLQRAVKEHKIHLEYEGANENVYNNVYIEGINHIYEFSAGPLSGWMYRVNGVYPSYGCSQYVLKDGDQIEWHYTVDLGRDLGADGR